MARIRTVKPEFFLHEGLFDLEQETGWPMRIAFEGLWCHADREGRFKWQPRSLKAGICPFDDCDFSRVLDAFATRGFLIKYACSGVIYGVIPTFRTHQIINNKERESTLPSHNATDVEVITCTREAREDHAMGTRDPREGKGREQVNTPYSPPRGTGPNGGKKKRTKDEADAYTAEFEEWWLAYPSTRRTAKRKASSAWDRAWHRISKRHEYSEAEAKACLLVRTKEFAKSPKGLSQFVPLPSTWLNGACYDDDKDSWQRGDDRPSNGEPIQQRVLTSEELKSWKP